MYRRRTAPLSVRALPPEQAPSAKAPAPNSPVNVAQIAPTFCPVDLWCRLSGLSRSATYKALQEGWLPSLKVGKARLIDFYPAIEAVRLKFAQDI
jgi:hypothetical protein